MLGKKVAAVMPAYNVADTLKRTWSEILHEIVGEVVRVDDHSRDDMVQPDHDCRACIAQNGRGPS